MSAACCDRRGCCRRANVPIAMRYRRSDCVRSRTKRFSRRRACKKMRGCRESRTANSGAARGTWISSIKWAACGYLQLDDTSLAYLNDPAQRAHVASIGGDAELQHLTYIKLINAALAGRPAEMTVCTHMCRGNFRSSWVASGGYDHVAEALFTQLDVDGFFGGRQFADARGAEGETAAGRGDGARGLGLTRCYSIRMARKSLTFVNVGPVITESPSALKKLCASLLRSMSLGFSPKARARCSESGLK